MPWRTILNENDKPQVEFELEKVVRGFFRADLFLDYVRYFILFEQDGDGLIKKIAGYHQFHGVRGAGCGAGDPDRLGDGGWRDGEGGSGDLWQGSGAGIKGRGSKWRSL